MYESGAVTVVSDPAAVTVIAEGYPMDVHSVVMEEKSLQGMTLAVEVTEGFGRKKIAAEPVTELADQPVVVSETVEMAGAAVVEHYLDPAGRGSLVGL